jgi:hypothetical protein
MKGHLLCVETQADDDDTQMWIRTTGSSGINGTTRGLSEIARVGRPTILTACGDRLCLRHSDLLTIQLGRTSPP